MEIEDQQPRDKRRRRKLCICVIVSVILLLLIIVAVVLGLTQRRPHIVVPQIVQEAQFKTTFIARCEKFKGDNCEKIWGAFEQAYVGRDPCEVPMEAYEPLIAAAPFKLECNKMMFWSKTKDVVHDFTKRRDCFITLEDTLLGFVLNDLTWCGKEGSNETFTSGCPRWNQCVNNSVGSFWNKASSAFASISCGDVTAMLNGSIAVPFSKESVFGSIEVKRFDPSQMRSLNVVLVTQENTVTSCSHDSLKTDLRNELPKGIQYNCKEVTEAQIRECSSHPDTSCRACW